MTLTVKGGHAKTHLSDLLAKVEAGEEVVIARGNDPIAKLTRIPCNAGQAELIEEIVAVRRLRKPTTPTELMAWRGDGRRG